MVMIVGIGWFITLFASATGTLKIHKSCGEVTCAELEYCSSSDMLCRPCWDICNTTSHNFQHDRCEEECQDYLHDLHYMKISTLDSSMMKLIQGDRSDIDSMKRRVSSLEYLVIVMCVTQFLLIIILLACCLKYKAWANRIKKFKPRIKSKTIPTISRSSYPDVNPKPEVTGFPKHSLTRMLRAMGLKKSAATPISSSDELHLNTQRLFYQNPSTGYPPVKSARQKRVPSEQDWPAQYDNPGMTPATSVCSTQSTLVT